MPSMPVQVVSEWWPLSILFDLPCDHRALNFVGKCVQVIGQFGERFSLGFVCGQIGDQPVFCRVFAELFQAVLIIPYRVQPL